MPNADDTRNPRQDGWCGVCHTPAVCQDHCAYESAVLDDLAELKAAGITVALWDMEGDDQSPDPAPSKDIH